MGQPLKKRAYSANMDGRAQMKSGDSEVKRTRIEVVGEINQPLTYANFARVQMTPHEGIITFARIDPATASGEAGETAETVDAPAVARIVLPHKVMAGLYNAIRIEDEKHGYVGIVSDGDDE
jgi:hypothetical protein